MKAVFVLVVLVACQRSSTSDKPPAPKAEPTAALSAPTAVPAPAPTAPRAVWEQHAGDFLTKFSSAVAGAGGDCEKLAAGIEPLAGDAKVLREELVAVGKKLRDYVPTAAEIEEMKKLQVTDPEILDRCEKANKRASAALTATLLVIQPLSDDPALGKATGEAVGKAAAVK